MAGCATHIILLHFLFILIHQGSFAYQCRINQAFLGEWLYMNTNSQPVTVVVTERLAWYRVSSPSNTTVTTGTSDCIENYNYPMSEDQDPKITLLVKNGNCYSCIDLWLRNENIVQGRYQRDPDVCISNYQGLASMCSITEEPVHQSRLATVFRTNPKSRDTSCPWYGAFQYRYESSEGDVCDHSLNQIKACPSVQDGGYQGRRHFTMDQSSCSLIHNNEQRQYNYQCMGSWEIKDADGVVTYAAVHDLDETKLGRKFKCLMTHSRQASHDGARRWVMSRYADCVNLHTMDVAPIKLLLRRDQASYNQSSAPSIIEAPEDITVLGASGAIIMTCLAYGNPPASYEWRYTTVFDGIPHTFLPKTRFFANGGRLLITAPSDQDEGWYQCAAINDHSTVLSPPARLVVGNLGQFSNIVPDQVQVDAFTGAHIPCPNIYGTPGIRYAWYKDNQQNIINPDFNPNTYISSSGDLFFSEVTESDQGAYYCMAALTSEGATTGSTSRTSLPTQLVVNPRNFLSFGPDLVESFIRVVPPMPIQGQSVRLECFAYGSELEYSWGRQTDNGQSSLPEGHQLELNNRNLVLNDLDTESLGTYVCTVYSRATTTTVTTATSFGLNASLVIVNEISDRVEMEGDRLTWSCLGRATHPDSLTYVWIKDGQVIVRSSGVRVQNNTLTIDSLDVSRDAGVYQCEVKDQVSRESNVTTAQLTVVKVGVACGYNDTTPMPYSCNMEMDRCYNKFSTTPQTYYHLYSYKNCVSMVDIDSCDMFESQRKFQLIGQIEEMIDMMDDDVITSGSEMVCVTTVVVVTSCLAWFFTL